ncbi:MAG: hypothetical protein ACXWWL_06520 [Candidatus Limnocylindria bacterium]
MDPIDLEWVQSVYASLSSELTPDHVMTLRDGRVVRVRALIDREQALRAAGVGE